MFGINILIFIMEAGRIWLYARYFQTCIGKLRTSRRISAMIFAVPWLFECFMTCLFPNGRWAEAMLCDLFFLLVEIPFLFLLSFCCVGGLGRRFLMAVLLPAIYWAGKWMIVLLLFSTTTTDSRQYFIATLLDVFLFGLLEFVLGRVGKSRRELAQEALLQEIRSYENQFEVIRQSQNNIRSLKHDMKHHIKMLTDLVAGGENEAALHYLASMGAFMENSEEYVSSGNDRFDSILNYMISRAKNSQIAVNWKVQIPEHLEISAFDINVILSNLFENALNALQYVPHPILNILVKYDRGVLYIDMENNCVQKGRSFPESRSKSRVNGHGFGLKNIRRIAEKYHGSLTIAQEEGMFQASVLLFLTSA